MNLENGFGSRSSDGFSIEHRLSDFGILADVSSSYSQHGKAKHDYQRKYSCFQRIESGVETFEEIAEKYLEGYFDDF